MGEEWKSCLILTDFDLPRGGSKPCLILTGFDPPLQGWAGIADFASQLTPLSARSLISSLVFRSLISSRSFSPYIFLLNCIHPGPVTFFTRLWVAADEKVNVCVSPPSISFSPITHNHIMVLLCSCEFKLQSGEERDL